MLVAAFSVAANAQIKLGVSGGIVIPTAKGADYVGFGGGVSGEYLVTENIGIGLNLGYYILDSESGTTGGVKYSASSYLMPVAFNAKYYFVNDEIKVYGGLDLGYYTIGVKSKIGSFSISGSDGYFGLAPVVGLQFGLTPTLALDVNTKYNVILTKGDSTGMIGFNAGIVYKF